MSKIYTRCKTIRHSFTYDRPQRSWGKDIFSQASVILFTGVHAGIPDPPRTRQLPDQAPPRPFTPQTIHPPPGTGNLPGAGIPHDQAPPRPGTPRPDIPPEQATPHPPDQAPPGPGTTTPPRCRACWEIRSTRGRYASYWNAILLLFKNNWTLRPIHTERKLKRKRKFSLMFEIISLIYFVFAFAYFNIVNTTVSCATVM